MAVVLGHIDLELFRVGFGGRFPARLLCSGIEIIGHIPGV
jgi:hypothetical protein